SFDQRLPVSFLFLRDSRVAIPRQVGEDEMRVYSKEIDLARAPRRSAHAGKRFSANKSVEKGRLPDVRSSRERNLRKLRLGTPSIGCCDSANELELPDYEGIRSGVGHLSAPLRYPAVPDRRRACVAQFVL